MDATTSLTRAFYLSIIEHLFVHNELARGARRRRRIPQSRSPRLSPISWIRRIPAMHTPYLCETRFAVKGRVWLASCSAQWDASAKCLWALDGSMLHGVMRVRTEGDDMSELPDPEDVADAPTAGDVRSTTLQAPQQKHTPNQNEDRRLAQTPESPLNVPCATRSRVAATDCDMQPTVRWRPASTRRSHRLR